jgi:hypothetical protein
MKIFIYLLLYGIPLISFSQNGGIPVGYRNDPAVDLVYKGKLLLPEEVDELRKKGKSHFDISKLNPIESSDLWKDTFLKELPKDQIPISEMDEINYHSPTVAESGIFRFNVVHKENRKLYTMMLSKTIHSFLLAKSLLRKIGYQIPDIQYLPKVILNFKNKKEKLTFISYLENVAMAGQSSDWIVEELEDHKIILQDLVVLESNHFVYNLAVGVASENIQGRRLLASLAVPLSIVNLTESVNLLRWNVGLKNNNEIFLFYDKAKNFQCSWDDARWISRRIERLTREDWKDIVESSHTPAAVQQIMLEKMISRRNSALKLFEIDAQELKVDSDISNGVDLIQGKLTKKKWPGYASRFAFGDDESPLADSEMKSFMKSKLISAGIDFAMTQFNDLSFLETDIAKMNSARFQKNVENAAINSVKNGTPFELPLKAWVFPTFRGQLIFSRNLVTGTYLGTDNLVQLVDTIGVSFAVGAFGGTMGLPTPIEVLAKADAQILRTYAHLRPVTSIEKSLKYGFKNMLIPLVKKDYGEKLHDAMSVVIDPNATEELKASKIGEALKPFKDVMEIGESILVTDSISSNLGIQVGAGYKKLLSISLGLVPGYNVVSRFHIHRKTEHDFQIYKDLGQVRSAGMAFTLDSLIPVLTLNFKKSNGKARVKFYSLNLDPKNPQVLQNISLLRHAVLSSSMKSLDEDEKRKPYIIKHEFKESNPRYNVLFWHWQPQNSSTRMSVENPDGDERFFRRHYLGRVKGKNHQRYVTNLVSYWINLIFSVKARFSDGGDNPGYSFKGKAVTRYLTLDEEILSDGKKMEPFIKLSKIYNGWSIKRKDAEKIINNFEQKYNYDFFNAPVLNNTQRIFLYNISFNVFFYKKGIEHLLSLEEEAIRNIFRNNLSHANPIIIPAKIDDEDTGVHKFLNFLTKFKKSDENKNFIKANYYLLKTFSQAEHKLNLHGLIALMGGSENLYINSRIDGFREGDEAAKEPIVSDSVGEFGSSNILGPLNQLQRQVKMLEGEFFIYWMMTRLI